MNIGLSTKDFQPISSTLTGFTKDFITPLRITNLYVTFGLDNCSKIVQIKFLVVDISYAYNAIINRPTLNHLYVVILTYYMTLEFSTSFEVGEVKSDPRESH